MNLSAVVLVAFLSINAAPTDPIPFPWQEVLRPGRAEQLGYRYVKLAKERPGDLLVHERACSLLLYAWTVEEKDLKKRHAMARLIIQTADQIRKQKPDKPHGHYWYGTGLGLLGLSRGILNSVQMVPEGKKALEQAIAIDPDYMSAAAFITLGRIYMQLPGFPISIGNDKEALRLTAEGVRRAPGFALAKLYMADMLWMLGKEDEARNLLKQIPHVKPVTDEEHIMADFSKRMAAEMERRIRAGEKRDRYNDWIMMKVQPGLVD